MSSIPTEPSRQDVAVNADLALHTADEIGAVCARRNKAGYRLAVLGDLDSFGIEIIQQCQALFFKLGRTYLLHHRILPTRQYVQSFLL